MVQEDYSQYVVGASTITHFERIKLGLTIEQYVFFDFVRKSVPGLKYKDYWQYLGLLPSEVRSLISQLKVKGYDLNSLKKEEIEQIEKIKTITKKIHFQESDIFDKKIFATKFQGWSEDKLEYYWTSADAWSEEGNKKINWYKTILTWERRDSKEGKLKFNKETKEDQLNFFANR